MSAGDRQPHPAHRWAEVWQRAWEARDVEAIVALYDPEALFSTQPFREAHRGRAGVRDYVTQALAVEEDVRAWFGQPIIDGDLAAVRWWAALVEEGVEITLAGTSVLRFGADGLVVEQRDSWNQAEGRRDPPGGWGRSPAATG